MDHREFPFWERKIPPAKEKNLVSDNAWFYSLYTHTPTQWVLKPATFIGLGSSCNDMVSFAKVLHTTVYSLVILVLKSISPIRP